MHPKVFFWPIAAGALTWITIDQFVDGSVKLGAVATVVFLPIYQKYRSAKTEADTKERESRRKDVEDELKRSRGDNAVLTRRCKDLERQCKEWRELYDSSGSRDHPKMG